jgi:hypothetical protein
MQRWFVILVCTLGLSACAEQLAPTTVEQLAQLARAEAVGSAVHRFNPCGSNGPRTRDTTFDAITDMNNGDISIGSVVVTAGRC